MWGRVGAWCLSWWQRDPLGTAWSKQVAPQPGQAPGPLIHSTPPLVPTGPWAASTSMDRIPRFGRQHSSEFDGLFLAYLCTTQPWWSYTCPRIRQYFPYLEVLYRSSQDKKTVCHYRSKSMWYTNLCKLHWTVSKICVTLVLGPKFYVNYVSFSAYLREQPTSFPLNTSLGALA